ncbi:Filamin-A [Orchesella cincta]|uniref:Filamin-A n=1 Tax=Orchesella cincta TaxID=48709 RepID=A0A1D2MDC3_ORCCI|nr:Filamin-A [Orchesella cincta]
MIHWSFNSFSFSSQTSLLKHRFRNCSPYVPTYEVLDCDIVFKHKYFLNLVVCCDTLYTQPNRMKIMGNKLFDHQLSKLSGFRKRNGKSMQSIASAQSGSGLIDYNNPEVQRTKRLMSFVKGIQVSGPGISAGTANMINEFMINLDTFDYDNLTFDLYRMTSNGLIDVGMEQEMVEVENHVKIFYAVENSGQYTLDIKYLGVHVPASPFKIDVRRELDASDVKCIVVSGKGMKRCTTGEIASFQLESKKAGHGQLSVAADGRTDIPVRICESKSGYKIQYLATTEGKFFLRVKIGGMHIPGSPFLITASKQREIPESAKNFFKRGFLMGNNEKKNDLQP